MDWGKVIQYGVPIVSGGFAGAVMNQICDFYRNRVQKMRCCYIEDDIQSKIPIALGDVK